MDYSKLLSFYNQYSIPINISLLIISIILIIILLKKIINNNRQEMVNKYSLKYHAVNQLNSKSSFEEIPLKKIYKDCTSKRMFDSTTPLDYFEAYIYSDSDWVRQLIPLVESNRKKYEQYCDYYDEIKNYGSDDYTVRGYNHFKYFDKWVRLSRHKWFQKSELAKIEEAKLHPITEPNVFSIITYKTPAGKHSYDKFAYIKLEDCLSALADIETKENYKTTKKYQRSLMTDSLRYDVMKRDGFRCQLCGQTAKDGAVLHVDHIIPVSKGGKTELSNLRTLCDMCNLGKRDKYDDSGIN